MKVTDNTISNPGARSWDQRAPRDAPFRASETIAGIRSGGWFESYTQADTWCPTWAVDGNMYSPFTDGWVHGFKVNSLGDNPATGQARISGDNPLDLKIDNVGSESASAVPYEGRYPAGSLVLDGVWYYGAYCLKDNNHGLNWDIPGPLVGFRVSEDLGQTWTDTNHTPETSLFGESGLSGNWVKFRALHFVDFGQNMEASPDGYVYLVGHGSMTSAKNPSWILGDDIVLSRVIPSPESINDPAAWQFFAGKSSDGDLWSSDVTEARPIASWPGHMGCVTITYHSPSKLYLMCVTDGWPTGIDMTSDILEADSPTGVWRMAADTEKFGTQTYFLNFPSRFMSPDGSRAWLSYSANFTSHMEHPRRKVDPPGSRYAMCLLELELPALKRDEDKWLEDF